jgi:DNA-binding transcriptional regulator YhcF (GntR family)
MFLSTEKMKGYFVREQRDEELKQQTAAYEKKKSELETQIAELRRIINDENQTVKAVKEAKEKLNSSENELRMLHPHYRNNNLIG